MYSIYIYIFINSGNIDIRFDLGVEKSKFKPHWHYGLDLWLWVKKDGHSDMCCVCNMFVWNGTVNDSYY